MNYELIIMDYNDINDNTLSELNPALASLE